MEKVLFLDLEDTIIDTWTSRRILPKKVDFIKSVMNKFKPSGLGLFSFAVDNKDDVHDFNMNLRSELEEVLNAEFLDEFVFSVEDMVKHVKKITFANGMDWQDFFTFFNKEKAMIDVLKAIEFRGKACLIDDTVDDNIFLTKDFKLMFKNI